MGVGAASLLLLLPISQGSSPANGWGSSPLSWSNGSVLCEFAPTQPLVTVSALAREGTGLTADLESISEVDPEGLVAATSNLSSGGWSLTNLSSESAYDLSFDTNASVTAPNVPGSVLGSAGVRVDFILPTYGDRSGGSTDTVALKIVVSNWSWQGGSDNLELVIGARPEYPNAEHLDLGSPVGTLLSGVSTTSGSELEEISGSDNATVTPRSGAPTTVAASATVSGNGSGAVISVKLGSGNGAYSILQYSAEVRVLLPNSAAGVPASELVAVGGLATLVTVLVAMGTRRVRHRPSDLIYAGKEEP